MEHSAPVRLSLSAMLKYLSYNERDVDIFEYFLMHYLWLKNTIMLLFPLLIFHILVEVKNHKIQHYDLSALNLTTWEQRRMFSVWNHLRLVLSWKHQTLFSYFILWPAGTLLPPDGSQTAWFKHTQVCVETGRSDFYLSKTLDWSQGVKLITSH